MEKRILIDATNVDISLPGGGSFCTKAYIEALLTLYPNRVDILHPDNARIRDPRYRTIDVPGRTRWQALKGALYGQFHRAGKFLIDYLESHATEYQYVLISTGLYAGSLIPELHRLNVQVIVLHHNFEPEYRLASQSPLTLFGRTDRIVRYWERKGYKGADINLFLTSQDKTLLETQYGDHPHNYVTGVFEPTSERQTLDTEQITESAVITCALSDQQNEKPLIQFYQTYLPLFHSTLPDWTIQIMGRKPLPSIQAMHDGKVVFVTPDPDDIRLLAAKSAIYLCPMDAGGGLKLRIMDGLRAGQPVLTHIRAARGYDDFVGQPFFLTYSNPESFVDSLKAIVRYIHSAEFGRDKIQTQYYNHFGLESGVMKLKMALCK